MRMTMSTRNVKGVVANLFAADAEAQRAIRVTVDKYGHETHDLAVALCPFDTGFMQEHLHLRFTENGVGYEVGWEEQDFTDAGLPFYPVYQEFGTVKMAAQPSLFPANAYVRPRFTRALKANVRAAVTRRRKAG
jgi:HK97 gp10 family phage protein